MKRMEIGPNDTLYLSSPALRHYTTTVVGDRLSIRKITQRKSDKINPMDNPFQFRLLTRESPYQPTQGFNRYSLNFLDFNVLPR